MSNIDSKIFNTEKTDYEKVSLLLGEQDIGLFDTINKQFPDVWKLYKQQKSQDWDEQEFNYATCNKEFKTCSKAQYDTMIYTLAWQWEADSIASRSIATVLAPFITSSELWAAWLKISEIEVLHAATYSEIVRLSFDDPRDALDDILSITESMQRLETVAGVFADTYTRSHQYALGLVPNDQKTYDSAFLFICGLYALERIQFMSSFAVTFANCETGLFQPIGKAVQKIAQDELEVHCELDKAVLRHEMRNARGQAAFEGNKELIKKMIDEVVQSELDWVDFLFSEGRELVGLNADVLKQWVLFNAKDVYNFFKIESEHKLPRSNPLKFMEKWLNINATQAAPQEQDIAEYRLNILQRDDDDKEFDVDF